MTVDIALEDSSENAYAPVNGSHYQQSSAIDHFDPSFVYQKAPCIHLHETFSVNFNE
jgi:hypothetical protein